MEKFMLKSARSSEKEILTKKRWKTPTLLIFIFFIIIQVASLFIDLPIMGLFCYPVIIVIGSFVNSMIYRSVRDAEKSEAEKRCLMSSDFIIVWAPYLIYDMLVLLVSCWIPLPILFFLPYFVQLEMSEKCFYRLHNILTIVWILVSIISILIGCFLHFCDIEVLLNPIENFITEHNVYQYLPANLD